MLNGTNVNFSKVPKGMVVVEWVSQYTRVTDIYVISTDTMVYANATSDLRVTINGTNVIATSNQYQIRECKMYACI